MSNETPPKPEKKRAFFYRWVPTSVAGKASVATFVLLLLTLILVWALRRFGPQSVPLSHAITPLRMVVEIALVVVIPAVLYWGIRRWNTVIEGIYPDIDRAWQKGIDALEAQGISLDDYPLFLILGSASTQLEQGLIHALEARLPVDGIPNEPGIHHALQWYVGSDAIYVFCPGASSLSALLGRWPTSTSADGPRLPLPVPSAQRAPSPANIGSSGTVGPKLTPISRPTVPPAGTPTSSAATPPPSTAAPPSPATTPSAAPSTPAAVPPTQAAKERSESYLGTIQFESVAANQVQKPLAAKSSVKPNAPSLRRAVPADAPIAREVPRVVADYGGTVSVDHLAGSPTADAPAALGAGGGGSKTPFRAPSVSESGRDLPGSLRGPAPTSESAGRPESQQRSDVVREGERMPASDRASSRAEGAVSHAAAPVAAPVAAPRLAVSNLALPPALDTSDHLARLRYVCKLLSRSRRPRCGANGIVTLIPFELSRAGPLQLSALAQSARGDVNTIQETLGIRAPVTAVLVGLEQDNGFVELVRRLQPELLSRRLGGRFDLRSRPTPEELNAHSDRLCDAFEDWIYRLFGRDDALAQQRGNRKLYALISRIRHELKPRLRIVLGEAFGCQPSDRVDRTQEDQSFFFSGCYFAGSGSQTGQPAFVKGVLHDKLIEEQSQVEWTADARRSSFYLRMFAWLGWIVTAVLAAALLAKWLG